MIRKRNEGGKIAAAALRAAVANIVGDRANELEVLARVVANVSGLGKAMVRDGCLDNQQDFKDFTLGFTQAKASFDFIDVGYGKERADTKIKGTHLSILDRSGLTRAETTRWHLQNSNCKQILLGISHDAGYAPFLDEILTDSQTRGRISVLEGFPTVRELRETRVHIERFSRDVFRTTKLVDRSPNISLPNGAMNGVHGMLTPATSNASMSPPLASASTVSVHTISEAPTPTPAPAPAPVAAAVPVPAPVSTPVLTPVPAASSAVSSSYANIMAAPSPPPQMHIPLAPKAKKAAPPPPPAWVPEPRGLDKAITNPSTQAMDTIKRRKEHNKLCNNHYLRGPCTKIDSCLFVHNYKPTKDEIRALAMLSRLNPCTRGQDCEVEDCIYGHHVRESGDAVDDRKLTRRTVP